MVQAFARALVEWRGLCDPRLQEGFAITLHDARPDMRIAIRDKPRHRLGQRQADDLQHLFARQRGATDALEGQAHRAVDMMLTVDQRAIDIEDDQFHSASAKGSSGTSLSCQPRLFQVRFM